MVLKSLGHRKGTSVYRRVCVHVCACSRVTGASRSTSIDQQGTELQQQAVRYATAAVPQEGYPRAQNSLIYSAGRVRDFPITVVGIIRTVVNIISTLNGIYIPIPGGTYFRSRSSCSALVLYQYTVVCISIQQYVSVYSSISIQQYQYTVV